MSDELRILIPVKTTHFKNDNEAIVFIDIVINNLINNRTNIFVAVESLKIIQLEIEWFFKKVPKLITKGRVLYGIEIKNGHFIALLSSVLD